MNSTANQDGNDSIRVTADNMMRRVLRIQNPSDPREVAQGLGRAYPTESAELDDEIRGLPVAPPSSSSYQIMAPSASMTGLELAYAQDNIKRDLDFLVGSSQLKEVQVELQGWGETIRGWLGDGAAAAAQALDPNARDRVFSARRILVDYARVSRLVGAMTPGLSIAFRRLSRSLDEASGLLLVSLGETLAQVGFSGDRLLLQAPASELSARAEHAVSALRHLIGSELNGYARSGWDRGSNAYRLLLTEIESGGHSDIRVLLQENGLRAFADELINRASSVTGDGLRTLAATHGIALNRVDRLTLIAQQLQVDAPPLTNFIDALRLFVDSFMGGTTTRLIAIGRPLLSASWLYSSGSLDRGKTQTLISLVRGRAAAAQLSDTAFGLQLDEADAQTQFQLDTCLYALDLAIDLYAVGMETVVPVPIESRAAAYGLFVWQLLAQDGGIRLQIEASDNALRQGAQQDLDKALSAVVVDLSAGNYIANADTLKNVPGGLKVSAQVQDAIVRELVQLDASRLRLQALADAISPGVFSADAVVAPVGKGFTDLVKTITGSDDTSSFIIERQMPPTLETSAARSAESLQKGVEVLPPRIVPFIKEVTFEANRSISIEGSGFVDVVAVLFREGGGDWHLCQIRAIEATHLVVTHNNGKRDGKGDWELIVATSTGAARASDSRE
jgi:hypothetical protein